MTRLHNGERFCTYYVEMNLNGMRKWRNLEEKTENGNNQAEEKSVRCKKIPFNILVNGKKNCVIFN